MSEEKIIKPVRGEGRWEDEGAVGIPEIFRMAADVHTVTMTMSELDSQLCKWAIRGSRGGHT